MASHLFHIIGRDDWADAVERGRHVPDDYVVDGFIHLSEKGQVLRPANLLYKGRNDLVLLVIDPGLLRAEVVYEPGSHGEQELFPHLYGPLNLDAVLEVVTFLPDADGAFVLPPGLGD
ncbi:MAG: DUF952 domain-containing protein [Acidimicrobiales bacterium]